MHNTQVGLNTLTSCPSARSAFERREIESTADVMAAFRPRKTTACSWEAEGIERGIDEDAVNGVSNERIIKALAKSLWAYDLGSFWLSADVMA